MLVFVAPNCDAMCACRILSYMLRADAVSYKIKPVAGYGDIAAANEELIEVCWERNHSSSYQLLNTERIVSQNVFHVFLSIGPVCCLPVVIIDR